MKYVSLLDIHNDVIQLFVNHIVSIKSVGRFTEIQTTSGQIQVQESISEVLEVINRKESLWKRVRL